MSGEVSRDGPVKGLGFHLRQMRLVHQQHGLRLAAHLRRGTAKALGQVVAGGALRATHVHQVPHQAHPQSRFLERLTLRRGLQCKTPHLSDH